MTNDFLKNLSEEEVIAFNELRHSDGWAVIGNLAKRIVNDVLGGEVPSELPAEEYKIESEARKKARAMFIQIFDEVKGTGFKMKQKKVDMS